MIAGLMGYGNVIEVAKIECMALLTICVGCIMIFPADVS